jgi:hypothetical protein
MAEPHKGQSDLKAEDSGNPNIMWFYFHVFFPEDRSIFEAHDKESEVEMISSVLGSSSCTSVYREVIS